MTWVKLFKDIGLNQSMKKTLDFTSKIEQVKWFRAKEQIKDCVSINDVAYNKFQNVLNIPIGPDELIKSYDMAQSFTYAEMGNVESATISNRHYYFFVSDVILIDDSTVHFILTLDPIQTYMCEYELDECMVNVAHVDRWIKLNQLEYYPARVTPQNTAINCYMEYYNVAKINTPYKNDETYPLSITDSEYVKNEDLYVAVISYTNRLNNNVHVRTLYTIVGKKVNNVTSEPLKLLIKVNETPFGYSVYDSVPIDKVIKGQLPSIIGVPTEDVLYVALLPIFSKTIYSMDLGKSGKGYRFKSFYESASEEYLDKFDSFDGLKNKIAFWVWDERFYEPEEITVADKVTLTNYLPPENNSKISEQYEPMLGMEPYTKVSILNGVGFPVMDIPQNMVRPGDELKLNARVLTGNSSCKIALYVSNKANTNFIDASANGSSTLLEPIYIDVVNNHWLDYYLTERTQDRNIISNNNINAAIDNLMFMSYGGALVGSRSASGVNDPSSKNATGNSNIEGFQKFRGMGGMASAVGMASGASVVTSLVDTHFAWENQKEYENKIKNKPNGILQIGSGQELANDICSKYYIATLVCDRVNMVRAFERFTHYGYELNQFMKLNTRSRKLYNFVMTNGAIIKGSIPNKIKEQIATIFDNGITIFHADYSPNTEYTDEENIERSLM